MAVRSDTRILFEQFAANRWRFLAIHVAVNVLIVVLLLPAASLSLRAAVALSGEPVLSDEDILLFVLSPLGLLSFIVTASLFGMILFLEYAALITAAWRYQARGAVSIRGILLSLARRAPRLFRLAARVLILLIVFSLPFVLVLVLIHQWFLSAHDINYYIALRPPEWRQALMFAAVTTLGWGLVLFRILLEWIYCLPLLLIRGSMPKEAMRKSRRAVRGRRWGISAWLLAWLVLSALLALAATTLVQIAGRFFILPAVGAESLQALLLALGSVSLLGFAASFAVSFFSSAMLCLLIVQGFSQHWPDDRPGTQQAGAATGGMARFANLPSVTFGLALGLAVSGLAAHASLKDLPFGAGTGIMAHRGFSLAAPENTLAAVRAAIEAGAHWVEIDVQETADGAVVVIHDRDLKKVAGLPLEIRSTPLRALRQPDVGSWFDASFSAERLPTLEEVLNLCRGRIHVNIELKYYGPSRVLEQRVAEIVDAAGMADEVAVMSLSVDGIRKMRQLRPGWKLGLLSTVAVGDLAGLDVDFLALNARFTSRALVRRLHQQGREVMVWTVNDPLGMSVMIGRGVDMIITDDPGLGVSILAQHEALSPTEHLLMQLADLFQQPALYQPQ